MAVPGVFSMMSASASEFCPGGYDAAAPGKAKPVVQLSLAESISMPEPAAYMYNPQFYANAAQTMLNLDMYSDDSDSDADDATMMPPAPVTPVGQPVNKSSPTSGQVQKKSSSLSVTSTASYASGDEACSSVSDVESEATTPARSISASAAPSTPEVPEWRYAADSSPASVSYIGDRDEARVEKAPWRRPVREALQVSAGSWAAQQRLRRGGTAEPSADPEAAATARVQRSVRAILNKLSIEKFEALSKQLFEVEYETVDHIRTLIKEVFEKATTQHHYIDMYTDLCEKLHKFFLQNPVSSDQKEGFKRLLLIECQQSFERNLQTPAGLDSMDEEDRMLAEVKYKTRMLGNIRFVGALLSRGMVASKVLMFILQELLANPSPEALETTAALLTVTGPTFDTADWTYYGSLKAVFMQLEELVRNKAYPSRVRCLLQDVLDLRAADWEDLKAVAKLKEGPSKLRAVAQRAAAEALASSTRCAPMRSWA